MEAPVESSESDILQNYTKDIQHVNEDKRSYQLGSSTFIKLGFVVDDEIPSNSFHKHNDGLASCFQNEKYPLQTESVRACSIKEKD